MTFIGMLMVSVLAACGSESGSDSDPTTVTNTTNNAVEPSGEPSAAAVVTNSPADEVESVWTPYASDQPTPTVLAGAQCSYLNTAKLEFQTFEQMRAELHECNGEFAWPAGYEIDVEKFVSMWGSPSGGEVGIARTIITFNNSCAWMTAWLDYTQSGDQQMADKTLQYMSHTLPYWDSQGPPSPANADPVFQDPIDKATLGDPSVFLKWVNGEDCATYKLIRVDP